MMSGFDVNMDAITMEVRNDKMTQLQQNLSLEVELETVTSF
jgi:hypothetical protein